MRKAPEQHAFLKGAAVDLPVRVLGEGFKLLHGVRVLDLTSSVAGPYCTMLLGDMGADIIKVERPGEGDDTRSWGPPFLEDESLWYLSVNRNKRSVALNIDIPRGKAALDAIIKTCDVVVVNKPPQICSKLGVDAAACRALRDDLVYVSITGFGLSGERKDWTCYDLIAEGYSGIMDITGDADGGPQKVGAPAADMLAGTDAAFATVAALFERQRTNRGHIIDISLVESMTRFLSCRIVPYMGSSELPKRSGGTDSVIAIYQAFETADLPVTLALGSNAIWRRFWMALGREEMVAASAYASNQSRRERRAEIVKEIQQILRRHPRGYWLEKFEKNRIPAGPINRVDEVVADPEFQRRQLFYNLDAGDRLIPQVGTGIHIDGLANQPRSAPPRLGESTVEVLRDVAGLSDGDIAELHKHNEIRGLQ